MLVLLKELGFWKTCYKDEVTGKQDENVMTAVRTDRGQSLQHDSE